MKLGILITGLGVGGAENHLLKVLPNINQDKFVISLTNMNKIGKELTKKGIKVYYLGLNKFNLLSVILKFRKIIKKEKPDLLDTYLIHSNIFGRIFGRLFGVKKIISSVRNDYSDLKFLNFLDRNTRFLVDLYVPNSYSLVTYLNKKNKVKKSKIVVLPNGVILKDIYSGIDKKYNIRKELKINNDSFVIVSVARIQKQKNLAALVAAMRFVDKKIVLAIVGGDGGEKNHVEYIREKYSLEKKVFFMGERNDVSKIVNSADAFVLASFKEGMSNALLEAMALKKPSIVSNIPQNTELIKDGYNGFVFNHKSEKDIAKKINNAFKSKKLKKLGENSFKLIKEKYETSRVINKYNSILENVAKNG